MGRKVDRERARGRLLQHQPAGRFLQRKGLTEGMPVSAAEVMDAPGPNARPGPAEPYWRNSGHTTVRKETIPEQGDELSAWYAASRCEDRAPKQSPRGRMRARRPP